MSRPDTAPVPVPVFPLGTVLCRPDTGWRCLVAVASDHARLEAENLPAYLLIGIGVSDVRVEAWPATVVEAQFHLATPPESLPSTPGALTPEAVRFAVGRCVVHRKGGVYRILFGPERLRFWDDRPAYAYAAQNAADLRVWVRPAPEMEDGRFIPASD